LERLLYLSSHETRQQLVVGKISRIVCRDIEDEERHKQSKTHTAVLRQAGAFSAIITSFFDFEDNEVIQADLLVCAQAGLVGFYCLFFGIQTFVFRRREA
jgi:hypothetical protein